MDIPKRAVRVCGGGSKFESLCFVVDGWICNSAVVLLWRVGVREMDWRLSVCHNASCCTWQWTVGLRWRAARECV